MAKQESKVHKNQINADKTDGDKDRFTKEKLTVNENESVKDVDGYLDGLLEILDGNNNIDGALAVDELDKDENIL